MFNRRYFKMELAVLLGLLSSLFICCFYDFAATCSEVRQDTLRLHILASSNLAQAQNLKIKVRDAVLEKFGTQLGTMETKQQAENFIEESIPQIRRTALETLCANGCADDIAVSMETAFFSTKQYGDETLPAGRYDAVRIEIGKAEGHNWFCVMYPQICISSSSGKSDYTAKQQKAIKNTAAIKFAAVEIIEKIKEKIT